MWFRALLKHCALYSSCHVYMYMRLDSILFNKKEVRGCQWSLVFHFFCLYFDSHSFCHCQTVLVLIMPTVSFHCYPEVVPVTRWWSVSHFLKRCITHSPSFALWGPSDYPPTLWSQHHNFYHTRSLLRSILAVFVTILSSLFVNRWMLQNISM